MGKTKTKIMNDTQVEEPKKPARKLGRQVFDSEGGALRAQTRRDDLVEKLKAEFAAEEPKENKVKSELDNISPVIASQAKQSSQEKSPAQIASSSKTPRNDNKQKLGKTKPRSKKYQEIAKDLDKSKSYPLGEAIDLTKKLSYSKVTGTLEAHINTIQTGIRGLVSLPFVSGKKLEILVFGSSSADNIKSDTEDGITLGNEQSIEEINKGKVNFDLVITTPPWMPKLAKVARILGPRGLMPNPKNGTITTDLKKTIAGFQGGKTEYKTESKAPVIHLGLGKLDQPTEELSANIKILLQTLGKTKVKKVTLSPTMGPSVKLDLSSI